VYGGPRTEEGGREVECVGFRHALWGRGVVGSPGTAEEGLGLIGARRGQGLCPGKGTVHTPPWPMEKPTGESCERGFLQTFREQVRGLHDLLRQKPSSLL
jgi:hypothetical protein